MTDIDNPLTVNGDVFKLFSNINDSFVRAFPMADPIALYIRKEVFMERMTPETGMYTLHSLKNLFESEGGKVDVESIIETENLREGKLIELINRLHSQVDGLTNYGLWEGVNLPKDLVKIIMEAFNDWLMHLVFLGISGYEALLEGGDDEVEYHCRERFENELQKFVWLTRVIGVIK